MTPIPLQLKEQYAEQETTPQKSVSLPGVTLNSISVTNNEFRGLSLHIEKSKSDFERMDQQNTINFVKDDSRYANFSSNRVLDDGQLARNIREVIPSRSRIIVVNESAKFEDLNRTDTGFDNIQTVKIPETVLWPAVISKKVEKSKFLSITKEEGSEVKLNIHDNFSVEDTFKLTRKTVLLLKEEITTDKPRELSSGNTFVLKATQVEKSENNSLRFENGEIIILGKSDTTDKEIEVRIPIPNDSGFKFTQIDKIFHESNKHNHQHNLNILGALLLNINSAIEQIKAAKK